MHFKLSDGRPWAFDSVTCYFQTLSVKNQNITNYRLKAAKSRRRATVNHRRRKIGAAAGSLPQLERLMQNLRQIQRLNHPVSDADHEDDEACLAKVISLLNVRRGAGHIAEGIKGDGNQKQ
jgi:hypothetical protein